MNARRQHFVRAYLGEAKGNATKAAIIAGYSQKTAKQIGSELLTFPDVKAAIQRGLEKADLTTQARLQRLAVLADHQPKAISAADVIRANELILKVNGALKGDTGSSRITVNIGFLTTNQPARDVTEHDEQPPALNTVVLPTTAQLSTSGER